MVTGIEMFRSKANRTNKESGIFKYLKNLLLKVKSILTGVIATRASTWAGQFWTLIKLAPLCWPGSFCLTHKEHTDRHRTVYFEWKKKTFCDRRREQNIVLRKRSPFSTNVGEGHSRLSFVIRVETNPVLPVTIWTKHIFEPRRRTSQSFWPRRGTTCPEPCLSKRAHLEVYKEALLSLFSYYTWK